ncbi:hypothetical protein P7C73_g1157, partial [Tremellales sp. Uapishka_1]
MSPSVKLEECLIDAGAPVTDIFDLLVLHGGVVVKNFISKETSAQMLSELQPHLDAQAPKAGSEWQGSFFPSTTRKVSAVLTKSKTFGEALTMHPTYLAVADKVLSRRDKMRNAAEPKWSTSKPQVNVTSVLEIHPGTVEQVRLQKISADKQTLFIPGSHLTGPEFVPKKEDALRATMDVGDAFIIRTLAASGMTCGFLRQEENQYISHDLAEIKKLSPELQELAGWNISLPYHGWVEFGHPAKTLGRNIPDGDHFFFDVDQSDHPVTA